LALVAEFRGGHFVEMQFVALVLAVFAAYFFGRSAFLRFKAMFG
jgi:hypothetical protein